MILTNLIEKQEKKSDRTIYWAIAALVLVLIGLWFAALKNETAVAVRPLEVEEKESVISAIDRLQNHFPKIEEWTAEFKEELVKSSLAIYVSGEKQLQLIQASPTGLAVSAAFFTSDAVAQENSLLHIIAEKNSEAVQASDLAVVAE